jgi:hypothetical protein
MNWQLHEPRCWSVAAGLLATALSILFVAMPGSAFAEQSFDWRENLVCPPEHQLHEGILYCTGRDADGQGHTVHVVVVDLSVSSLRFEYVIPKGASDGHEGIKECRDPNVPAWGGLPAKGCFVPGNPSQYPRIPLSEAVERAREVLDSPQPVALLNADYTADDSGHGPEGLLVLRGEERLDGVAHCDDDYNAALRPWLGLGEVVDRTTGLLPARIDRLPRDGASVPDWIYTGIGGGPWLVRDGALDESAAICQSTYQLTEIDKVDNCYMKDKPTPSGPLHETYQGGSCRAAPHTAAGISADGQWLFLAVSTGDDRPRVLAEFLRDQLGATNVMKFDGGGSSQLWFAGESDVIVDPEREERSLNSFLAVYSDPGEGIVLPLAAEPVERVYFQVLDPDERLDLTVEFRNSGDYTWSPDDDIELRHEPFFLLSPVMLSFPLQELILPGAVAPWHLDLDIGKVDYERYQVYYKGEPLGADIAVIAVRLSEDALQTREELEEDIQRLIDEWQAKGETELDELLERIRKELEANLLEWLGTALAKLLQAAEEAANEGCTGSGLALVMVAIVLAWRSS